MELSLGLAAVIANKLGEAQDGYLRRAGSSTAPTRRLDIAIL
jgi:hypothetical protein